MLSLRGSQCKNELVIEGSGEGGSVMQNVLRSLDTSGSLIYCKIIKLCIMHTSPNQCSSNPNPKPNALRFSVCLDRLKCIRQHNTDTNHIDAQCFAS